MTRNRMIRKASVAEDAFEATSVGLSGLADMGDAIGGGGGPEEINVLESFVAADSAVLLDDGLLK